MAPKSQPDVQAQMGSEFFTDMQAKALDAFAAFAETNQRVLQGFVDLSVSTAKEGMRAYAELQSAAVEAARSTQPAAPAFRLVEANAQVVTRSAERLQASTERTGKEIQDALTSYISRMKDIYARN